jgi:hypothetical protein
MKENICNIHHSKIVIITLIYLALNQYNFFLIEGRKKTKNPIEKYAENVKRYFKMYLNI